MNAQELSGVKQMHFVLSLGEREAIAPLHFPPVNTNDPYYTLHAHIMRNYNVIMGCCDAL